jgi:hypothetical protein
MSATKETRVAQEDRLGAAASARLRGLDQAPEGDGLDDRDPSSLGADVFGFHVDDPEEGIDGDDPDVVAETDTDVVDALAEAFNARDLDALLDVVATDGEAPGLLGGDRDHLPDAVESLWHRRLTCCLTRGRVADQVVGVLWEHDGAEWWALATVHISDVDDDGVVGVLEFSDDPALLEEVEGDGPDDDLEEGSRWEEWEDGAD